MQDVPIAVSAFGEKALKAQGLDGPKDLVLSVPNVSFQRRATDANFQIRGIGTQAATLGGENGVGIHVNNAPLTTSLIAEAEFYDMERVEVLRGPQGTLYGRNATGGVVNLITNKPSDQRSGSVTAEFGNYDTRKLTGYVNLPLGDMVDLRVAGFGLQREGYSLNTLNGARVDSRKIWAGRVTGAFRPTENFVATLMWDGFSEDDTRGARKNLCVKDVGRTEVLGVPTGDAQAVLTQGCLPSSVYADNVYGSTNSLATFSGIVGRLGGLQPVDSFAGKQVSRNLRETELVGRPIYRPRVDLYQLNLEWSPTDALKATSLTSYNENELYTREDYTGGYPSVAFPNSPLAPTGTLTDTQFGTTDRLQAIYGATGHSTQWTQELRLQSNFEGPINFNVGGIYVRYQADYKSYVASNVANALTPVLVPDAYVDTLPEPDYTGHNYFFSQEAYRLTSKAAFGEVYWTPTESLRFTLGLRYTDDQKKSVGSGSTLFEPGRGPIFDPEQRVGFKETTGRLNVDWSPTLSFTDSTLVYASLARGYKAGGFNPPGVVSLGLNPSYDPEFVNAIEVGTKNTLLDGRLLLNITAFHYKYEGYQMARPVNRSLFNENVDATIKGLEVETIFEPVKGLRFNANLGLLDSKIEKGEVVDTFNRTRDDPRYVYISSLSGGCILNAQGLANLLATPSGPGVVEATACTGPADMANVLSAVGASPEAAASLAAGVYTYGPGVSLFSNGAGEGLIQSLPGNQLPNAPKMTASLGAQYRWQVSDDWEATVRGDFYWQDESYARYNNAWFDRIHAWSNVNAMISVENVEAQVTIQLYVKNALNEDTIVGVEIADENLGAIRQPALLDPRTYGISITKSF